MMIIASGLPGSGKSYFASRLSQEIGAQYLSSDLTRKEMDASGEYAFEDKLKVYEEMARKAAALLREGKNVVVDATFYRQATRDLFLTLAKLLHQAVCYFEIVANEDLVRHRLSQPRPNSEADFSVYELVKRQYESPQGDHLVIESTYDNLEYMLVKALDYIKTVDEGSSDTRGL